MRGRGLGLMSLQNIKSINGNNRKPAALQIWILFDKKHFSLSEAGFENSLDPNPFDTSCRRDLDLAFLRIWVRTPSLSKRIRNPANESSKERETSKKW